MSQSQPELLSVAVQIRLILSMLHQHGPLSVDAIATKCRLTSQVVSERIAELANTKRVKATDQTEWLAL